MNINGEQSTDRTWKERFYLLRQRRNVPIVIILAGVVVLLVFLLWPSSKHQAEEESVPVVSVNVAKAERGSISAEVTALGTITARREATVSSKIAGQIKQMALVRNKPVREGDVIATLETRDIQAQRAEAAAAAQEARINFNNLVSGTIPQTRAQDEKAVRD